MNLEAALRLVDEAVVAQTSRHLNEAQAAVVQGTWEGQSYEVIAAENNYTADYLKKDVGPKLWQHLSDFLERRVGKKTFRPTMESLSVDMPTSTPSAQQDWGEAPDVSVFYGRDRELAQLQGWIEQGARLVALLGLGGIGKTSLSVKLAQRLQTQFDCLIWRSLRNAPPFETLILEILQFLSCEISGEQPTNAPVLIARLLEQLRERKCLVVLDNLESIFQGSHWAGCYLPSYEAYGELMAQVSRSQHQSCLLLTSREMPKGMEATANRFVHVVPVKGLKEADARQIFADGDAPIDVSQQAQWRALNDRYGGNPLALKLVAAYIQELYGGDIAAFLADRSEPLAVQDLIQVQLDRLSPQELEIVYWLAISCRPVSWQEVRSWVVAGGEKVANAFQSLQKRYLIEKVGGSTYTQQPVVMEYAISQFCDRISEEIDRETDLVLLQSHALVRAEEKDYIRDNQTRLILGRVLQTLASLGRDRLIQQLRGILKRRPWGNALGYGNGNLLNLLQALQADLSGGDFSNLTIWQAYLQDAQLQAASFQGSDLSGCVFAQPFGSALLVALGANDQLATGDADGQILLWQVDNGQQRLACQGKFTAVCALAFSLDGNFLASGGSDGILCLWNAETGECLRAASGHAASIECLTFSRDGRYLASGSSDGTVKLWNLPSGQQAPRQLQDLGSVSSLAFSPDNVWLAVGYQTQGVGLWNLETGEWQSLMLERTAQLWSVAFDSAYKPVLYSLEQTELRDWIAIAITSDSHDNTLTLFDIQTGDPLRKFHGHTDFIQTVTCSNDGQWIASSSSDRTLRFWEVNTGQCHQTLPLSDSLVRCLSLSTDANLLASSSEERLVQLWDMGKGQCLRTLQSHVHRVWCCTFSPDNRTLASGSDDGGVRLFQASTGRCFRTFKGFRAGNLNGHQDWVYALAFSPDGSLLASGSYDRTIRLWQTDTGQFWQKLLHPQGPIQALAFSPDGATLACASDGSEVYLWAVDASRPRPIETEMPTTTLDLIDGIKTLCFSPDGQSLATGSDDGLVQQWKLASGQCLTTRQPDLDQIYAVQFTAENQLLAIGRCDRAIQIWNVATGECWKTLDTSDSTIDWVSISPDWQTLASGSSNDTIQLWDLATCDRAHRLKVGRPYEGTNIVGVTGITSAQKDTLIALGATDY